MALHDSLTGLPGTILLQERFEWAANLARRQSWKMALLIIDLDEFKAVNDTLRHAEGDQLLIQVAARMQGVLRQTDFAARLGGEEFVALLIDLQEEDTVTAVADKLLASLVTSYCINNKKAQISASIGIAMYPKEGEDLASLLKAADSAMYRAKRRGKNTYTVTNSHPPSPTELFAPLLTSSKNA